MPFKVRVDEMGRGTKIRTTGKSPRYIPRSPSARTMAAVPWMRPRYFGLGPLASSMSFVLGWSCKHASRQRIKTKTYLIVSEGVTASTASIIPAPSPAIDMRHQHPSRIPSNSIRLTKQTSRRAHFALIPKCTSAPQSSTTCKGDMLTWESCNKCLK